MIISENSPFRKLPLLDRKTSLFLDGIRYSIEMADLAYSRLYSVLCKKTFTVLNQESSSTEDQIKTQIEHYEHVSIFLDAWSVIDSVHRLRELLLFAPFIKGGEGFDTFKQYTEKVTLLRNTIQHLRGKIDTMVKHKFPIVGVLTWLYVPDPDNKIGYSCTLLAGTIFKDLKMSCLNPSSSNRKLMIPLDLITLNANEYSICLSDVMLHIEQITGIMELQLKNQFKNLPNAGSDIFLCLHFKWD